MSLQQGFPIRFSTGLQEAAVAAVAAADAADAVKLEGISA